MTRSIPNGIGSDFGSDAGTLGNFLAFDGLRYMFNDGFIFVVGNFLNFQPIFFHVLELLIYIFLGNLIAFLLAHCWLLLQTLLFKIFVDNVLCKIFTKMFEPRFVVLLMIA